MINSLILHVDQRRDRKPSSAWHFGSSSASRGACLLFAAVSWHSAALAQSDRVVISPGTGYSITWDGNNGGFSGSEPGTGPTNNLALASNGTVAFGSSEVDLNVHFIRNVNDGFYGNSSSWIPKFTDPPDLAPFIGLTFTGQVAVSSIAWGRDNGDNTEPACGGTCTDRVIGIYTLQVTTAANP